MTVWGLCAVACGLFGQVDTPSVEYLLDANESGVGMVRQIDMKITAYQDIMNDKPFPIKRHGVHRWSSDGKVDRYRYYFQEEGNSGLDKAGRPVGALIGDLLEDDTTRKVLFNWDPARPFALSFYDQGNVKAWFRPRQREMTSPFECVREKLFGVVAPHGDVRRSLREFVETSPKATLMGSEIVRGARCWLIKAIHPDRSGGFNTNIAVDLFIDPDANYLIRKTIAHYSKNSTLPNVESAEYTTEVVRFGRFPGGAVVPLELESAYITASGKVLTKGRAIASDLTVNEPLPSDALDFSFPENALVIEDVVKNNWRDVHVWGPDNKAKQVVRSQVEYDRLWNEAFVASRKTGPNHIRNTIAAVLLVAGIVLVSVYIVRRRRY